MPISRKKITDSSINSVLQTNQYVVGDYKFSTQSSDHDKWLICDGRAISRTVYSALFLAFGTAFGAGDGMTSFNLPNLKGRVPAAIGQGSGLTLRNLGQSIGEESHVLTIAEMPSHNHGIKESALGSTEGFSVSDGATTAPNIDNAAVQNTGGGLAHNNMQPTLFIGNLFTYIG